MGYVISAKSSRLEKVISIPPWMKTLHARASYDVEKQNLYLV